MRTESTGSRVRGIDGGRWLTGAGAGAVGAVAASIVLFATGGFDLSTVSVEMLGVLFMPGAVFGLFYAALAGIERLSVLAAEPVTGLGLGVVYGLGFWLTTVVGSSFDLGGLLAGVAFGVVVGLLYAVSPLVE